MTKQMEVAVYVSLNGNLHKLGYQMIEVKSTDQNDSLYKIAEALHQAAWSMENEANRRTGRPEI